MAWSWWLDGAWAVPLRPDAEALREDSRRESTARAEEAWRRMGSRTEAEARGIVASQLRRELSIASHAGHARML